MSIEERDEPGWLLLEAAREGTEEDLRAALDMLGDGDPDEYLDEYGQSALHLVLGSMPGMVGELLRRGADPDIGDEEGTTPLGLAAKMGNGEAFRAMVEAGGDVSPWDGEQGCEHLLLMASYGGAPSIVEACLAAGHDVMSRCDDGTTPLHCAATGGGEKIAEMLLRAGADPRAVDARGRTPLHRAAGRALRSESEMAEKIGAMPSLLLAAGADIDARDEKGRTPLLEAASNGEAGLPFAEFLLRAGANPDARAEFGETALHRATIDSKGNIVELLAKSIDPNARCSRGGTPLHWAARIGKEKACLALLAAGADMNIRNDAGETALDVANARTAGLLRAVLEKAELEAGVDAPASATTEPATPGRKRRI